MKKIIYGLKASGKSSIVEKISFENDQTYIDLDEYIVKHFLHGKSIGDFLEEDDKNEAIFRDYEYAALKKVLDSKFENISLGGGTMEFDRNREILSEYDVLKIYLEVDVKTQVERIFAQGATGNNNRKTEEDKKKEAEKLQKTYDERIKIYEAAADITIDTIKYTKEKVSELVTQEVDFQEGILPYRNTIDDIDDEFIARIKGTHTIKTEFSGNLMLNWWPHQTSINEKISKIKSKFLGSRKNKIEIEWTKELEQLLWNRFTVVSQIAEYKKETGKDAIQKGRKEKVKAKWIEGYGEDGGIIYEYIHKKSVELETEIMEEE